MQVQLEINNKITQVAKRNIPIIIKKIPLKKKKKSSKREPESGANKAKTLKIK